LLSPITTLGFILATLFGAVFHLIVGGDARRLALFLLCGWIGFGLGHVLGVMLEINIFDVGPLHIFTAGIGAIVALILCHLLTSNRKTKRSSG
jgi:uncharacterized membrane protein YeaQ/YmgE (transglycosylase-associated protein family)